LGELKHSPPPKSKLANSSNLNRENKDFYKIYNEYGFMFWFLQIWAFMSSLCGYWMICGQEQIY